MVREQQITEAPIRVARKTHRPLFSQACKLRRRVLKAQLIPTRADLCRQRLPQVRYRAPI